jgi:hypothetical protein
MATAKKLTKKELREYADDVMFEVFGGQDDFEQEYSLMSEELASIKTKDAIKEYADLLLEQYKEHMEEWSPIPKALDD